jgi:CRP-like cAMP-binding protein
VPEPFEPDMPMLSALDSALQLPSFFAKLEKETRATFLPSLLFRRYAKGEVVVAEGDAGGDFYVVLQGSLSVRKKRGLASEKQIAALSAGDTFGEVAVMAGTRRSASIVAEEPSVLVSLATRDLQKVIEREPDLGDRLQAQARARLTERHE